MHKGIWLGLGLRLILVIISICGIGAAVFLHFMGILSYPPSDMMARRYLQAVIDRNVQAVDGLAGDCQQLLEQQAQNDMKIYGGAEIRSAQSDVAPGTGSSDTIEFVSLTFEYRPKGSTGEWHKGWLDLISDYTPPGFRHLCLSGG